MARPTLPTLIERARANLSNRVLGSPAALLQHSVLEPLALIVAYLMHGLYGYLDNVVKQFMPDTATGTWLERWAQIFGLTRIAGLQTTGSVTFTGTNGETVPAGSVIVRADGVRYTTDADVTIAGGTATADVTAVLVGIVADTAEDVELQTESAITGIDSACTVAAGGLTGGADRESDSRLRSRLLLRIRKPPQGGTISDYEQWALAANPNVTRVFIIPGYIVQVLVVTDDGLGGITPSAGTLTAVNDYIAARMPITAQLNVSAPTPLPVNMTFAISPDTAEVQAAVEVEVLQAFIHRARPSTTFRRSWLTAAANAAVGEDYNNMTVPAADVTVGSLELPVPGTITFV